MNKLEDLSIKEKNNQIDSLGTDSRLENQQPDVSPASNPQRNSRKLLYYGLIAFFIVLVLVVIGFTYFIRNRPVPSLVNLQPGSIEAIPSGKKSNPITLVTFYIQVSATLRLTDSGYTLEEEFSPVFDDKEDKDYFSSVIKTQQSKKTICKIEKVNVDGQKETYYTTALYTSREQYPYSPGVDICLTQEGKKLPINKARLLSSVLIPVGPDTKEFNFYIGESLVKNIPKKANNFRISSLNKVLTTQVVNHVPVQGFDIKWNVETDDEDEIGIALQTSKGDEKWSTAVIGSYKISKSYFLDPSDSYYKAKTGNFNIRLLATNGFYASTWEEKDFIKLPISEAPKNYNKENLPLDFSKVWTLERDWLESGYTPQQGTRLEQDWLTVYIPQEAIPTNSIVAFTVVPEPTYENLSNIEVNSTFRISGSSDDKRNQLENLQSNLVIYQPLDVNNPRLALIHKETSSYYFWDENKYEWILIPSLVNFGKGYALAKYNKFGTFSLRGNPVSKAPKILSIEPNKIKYSQDAVITINGENFQGGSGLSVNFGIGGYEPEFLNSSTVRVKIAKGGISPGTYGLLIGNPDGQRTLFPKALEVEE